MAQNIPAALKPVKTFFVRGAEMARSKHPFADIISYACRSYALERAFKLPNIRAEPGVEEFLLSTLDSLEKDQAELNEKYTSDSGKLTKEKQQDIVKQFALEVFKKADVEYRNGLADKGTALSFYSAASFLEVADPNSEDLQKIRKAAKFKATEIMTAIKEGREPLPPNYKPVEAEEDENEGGDGEDPVGLPPAPHVDTNPHVFVQPSFDSLPINARLSYKGREFAEQAAAVKGVPPSPGTTAETLEAEGYARKAVEFFRKDNIEKGVETLCKALSVLEKRAPSPRNLNKGLTEACRADVMEYLVFAARSLECAGTLMSPGEAKTKAANLMSNALQEIDRC